METLCTKSGNNSGKCSGPCVDVRGLEVRVGNSTLLRDLSFSFSAPHFLAVLGPSGSGKTSMLRTLAGLNTSRKGSIAFCNQAGQEIVRSKFRCELGLVFQHLRLAPNLSVLTSVLCGRLGREPWWKTLLGFARCERDRSLQLLKEFGLQGFENAPVGRLSGGEKQRVAIIRALVQRPRILLADEPVSHLDKELARRVLLKLKQLAAAENFFICCVLHDESLADEVADSRLTISRDLPSGWSIHEPSPGRPCQ